VEIALSRQLSRHQLIAALLVARAVDEGGTEPAALDESYLRLPTDGLFGLEELRRGEKLLSALGLLVVKHDEKLHRDDRLTELIGSDDETALRLLMALVLASDDPLWLALAASGEGGVAGELIPDEAQRFMSAVVPDPAEREAMLLALGTKVDTHHNEEVGNIGERYVVSCCRDELSRLGRADLACQVRHVSLVSDQLGYDIVTPLLDGGVLRLEVKTTTRAAEHDLGFYLTRNEAKVGARDPAWRLVLCRLQGDQVDVVGWCAGTTLASRLPRDTSTGRWTTASIGLPRGVIVPRLPPLGSIGT